MFMEPLAVVNWNMIGWFSINILGIQLFHAYSSRPLPSSISIRGSRPIQHAGGKELCTNTIITVSSFVCLSNMCNFVLKKWQHIFKNHEFSFLIIDYDHVSLSTHFMRQSEVVTQLASHLLYAAGPSVGRQPCSRPELLRDCNPAKSEL